MRNWKELGEVPDSDDESFDDTDCQDQHGLQHEQLAFEQPAGIQDEPEKIPREALSVPVEADIWELPPSPDQKQDIVVGETEEKLASVKTVLPIPKASDIWDIESSLEEGQDAGFFKSARKTTPSIEQPASSPLSPPPAIEDVVDDEIDELGILPSPKTSRNPGQRTTRHNGPPSVSRRLITFEEDEISTPYVTITAPLPGRAAPRKAPRKESFSASVSASTSFPIATSQQLSSSTTPEPNFEPTWGETRTGGRRALRPRKPIQQHPYLLESVQYAHVMKSHGVKPIRVLATDARVPRVTESGDSQDQEFEATSSQEPSNDRAVDDESQPFMFDDEEDVPFALSPSPPKTSPLNLHHTSSQRSEANRTDDTSVLDDDFPSIEELARRPPRPKTRPPKRQLSPKTLPHSKRLARLPTPSARPSVPPIHNHQDMWDISPSPPAVERFSFPSQDLGNTSPPGLHARTPSTLAPASRRYTPETRLHHPVVDLTEQPDDDESSDSDTPSSPSSSKSGSEVVRRNGKRIRGVLPASWLRIDQQKNPGEKRKPQQIRDTTPEPIAPKRGVAVRKITSPKATSSALPNLSTDESDEDQFPAVAEAPASRQMLEDDDEMPLVIWSDHEDAGSVVEEDVIDRMFVGSKRNRSTLDGSSAVKRRRTTHKNPFTGRPSGRTRQPRITDVLGPANSKSSTQRKQRHRRTHDTHHVKQPTRRAATPPALSVLDVVGVQAPSFLKIAARTAKRRNDQGKSSPTHKHINLGNRRDNVDALSVLRDWKSGRIRPRSTATQHKKTSGRQPLRNIASNLSPSSFRQQGHAQGADLDTNDANSFSLDTGVDRRTKKPQSATKSIMPASRSHSLSAHPAQLETEETDPPNRVAFHAKKRALDALFRSSRKSSSTSSLLLEQQWASIRMVHADEEQTSVRSRDEQVQAQTTPRRQHVKSRFRKKVVPRAVDLQAAHYLHADDPLPADDVVDDVVVAEETQELRPQDKLYGLAPYGSKYTYHFDVFPLDRGVYFHSTSLVGSGWLSMIADPLYPERMRETRPRAMFSVDGKHLRWGPWDETVSSELGILVDWVTERLLSPQVGELTANAKPQEATAFLLKYMVHSISFPDGDSEKSFISRSLEVIDGFLNRTNEAQPFRAGSGEPRRDNIVQVITHMILVVFALHRISGSDLALKVQVEDLLTRTAKACVTHLLAGGLEDLRSLYGDLQRLSARERGIRSNHTSANSCVVLMRVLETARVPRASFWDITEAVISASDAVSGCDVRVFENLWRDMFTLLPLCEVDDFGVVKSGMRYTTPVEGWTLPQKLLKRVLNLYRENPRQPPSFNEYCRALAARCHYLAQEWGWRKCAGIIGTWFDFFGSQNLSHLRNEEVYKSPRFLEELSSNASLAIDPEDRCFHIFLKLLALVIQRLRKLGLTNDIKNLIARTLPNHNRQYLKEDTVHQRDLAALRNHHDLLCTLFWAAPPDLRPSLQLTEKLVVPGSSHKEACLINMRAWSQLARFVVFTDEGPTAFRPFLAWQNNTFQQVIEQYVSADSDIQQQVLALPKDGPRISEDVITSMVKQNRGVAMDMLFVSVKASFEVLKLTGSLAGATAAFNTYQLQQVFTRFNLASRDFDWAIVNLALDVLEHYVSRVEKAAEVQYSSDSTDLTDPQDLEEAILLLDHSLAEKLFSMGRVMLELRSTDGIGSSELARCTEKTVKLSGRMACRFIHSGLTRTASYFGPGKYGLFRESPINLGCPHRKFLPLFVTILIQNHVYDFKDVGATLFQLWMLSIVKPSRALAYESRLAEILKQRNLPYLQGVTVLPGASPDYLSNFDFFSAGISHMRKALRDADVAQGRQLRKEYAETLQSVQRKMKDDLSSLRPDREEHRPYMAFVRRIIGLIKSHGVGICVVDPFFTQPSADYSPPMEDPRLHTAGIVAYGVRLGEGDAMAASQLFYYLFNNFKIALINDKLEEEAKILENAMGNNHILSFVLSRTLPAIIWATAKVYEAWPLLDVYLAAMRSLLTRSVVSKEISDGDLVHVASLLSGILTWFRTLRYTSDSALTKIQLHIMAQLLDLAGIFQPSLMAHICSAHEGESSELHRSYTSFSRFAERAGEYIDDFDDRRVRRKQGGDNAATGVRLERTDSQPLLNRFQVASMCGGLHDFSWGPVFASGRELDPQVDSFANEIVRDVRQNWVVTDSSISLNARGPSGMSSMSSTQSGPGTRYEFLSIDGLFEKIRDRLRCWIPLVDSGAEARADQSRRQRDERMRVMDGAEFLF